MSKGSISRLTIKRHDTLPSVKFTVVQKDPDNPGQEIAVDLTGATGLFIMVTDDDLRTVKVNAAATITDALNGKIQYDWIAGDTDTLDDYLAELQLILSGGGKLTLPNDDTLQIKIVADYNNA